MNSFFKFLIILIIGSFLHVSCIYAEMSLSVCQPSKTKCVPISAETAGKDLHTYSFLTENRALIQVHFTLDEVRKGNWLYLGEVGDSFSLRLNGKLIHETTDGSSFRYFRYLSHFLYLPPELLQETNAVEIFIVDLNQSIFGIKNQIRFGHYLDILILSAKDFLFRTGFTLLSIFSLIFLITLCGLGYVFFGDAKLLSLGAYGLVSILYLASFTEIPRTFFEPHILSGPIHFTLRLLQDVSLCMMLISVLSNKKRAPLNITLIFVYLSAMCALWITFFTANREYLPVQEVMFYCAPLVALPAFLGLFLATQIFEKVEVRLLKSFFIFFVLVQVNDLFVFWQLYKGYFFVKWYIPFIFSLMAFVLFRQSARLQRENRIKILVGQELRQIAHDLKTPLVSLRTAKVFLETGEFTEANDLLTLSVKRISTISNHGLEFNRILNQGVSVCSVVQEINEYFSSAAFRDIKVQIHGEVSTNLMHVSVDSASLLRIIENLIENSRRFHAKDQRPIGVDVKIDRGKRLLVIVSDAGGGFSETVLKNQGTFEFSGGTSAGNGFGHTYIRRVVTSYDGEFKLSNSKAGGAIAEVTFRLS